MSGELQEFKLQIEKCELQNANCKMNEYLAD
jgi:hypothetical protein